jgi:hypothetical protein
MKMLFEENFIGNLDPDWVWVHEQSNAWKLVDGVLYMQTLPGTLWGDANNAHNFLLCPVESAELQLALLGGILLGQFRTSPTEGWQTVGECPLLDGANPKIGLFTHGGPQDIERWIELRNFALLNIE